jgi:nucleoside-diphosphate-sugar epimerase
MRVLVLGANGMLGPHVVRALEAEHTLRLTDIGDRDDTAHEYIRVDVSDLDAVVSAAEGMDAIVNLSVLREDRQIAFDVSARGAYNAMVAAVTHGIPRVINTGPHFTVTGPSYEGFDYEITPDVPPAPGTNLYALTKSLGQEISRVFTENHDVHVLTLLFYNFRDAGDHSRDGEDVTPFAVTWEEAAQAFRPALTIDLDTLPSRCEVYFVTTDLPHGKFSNAKTKRVLGWQPRDRLEGAWRKA